MTRRRWMLTLVALVALVGLGACSDDGDSGGTTTTDSGDADGAETEGGELEGEISIESHDFEFEGEIPAEHGRDGPNTPPSLGWSVAVDAAELVLLMEDPDAGDVPFVHWMVAGLPVGGGLLAGALPETAVEGTTDFGAVGYGGPAPPPGERHRYVFRLIALDAPSGLEDGFTREALQAVIDQHFVVAAETAGFFESPE